MERATIDEAKNIFGHNFIGIDELLTNDVKIGLSISDKLMKNLPDIPFNTTILNQCKNDYMLILQYI